MIVFKSVYKTFDPDESGVKDISFQVDPGELVMVTGHSGSGKTTLMRLLTKEYNPSEGEIEFDGQNLNQIKRNQLHQHRRKIGVVFQDYRLVPEMNVWENIALPLSILGKSQADIEERVTDLLNLVQLTQKAHLFPSQLSGGEAQRISIARALAIAPSVIFADEPTGNLDQDTSLAIAQLLKQINDLGTTLIFATHDPKVLSVFADKRHLHLKEGSLEFDTAQKGEKTPSKKKNEKETVETSSEELEKKDEEIPTKEVEKQKKAPDENQKKKESTPIETKEDALPEDEKETPKKTRATGFLGRFFKSKAKKEETPTKEVAAEKDPEITEEKPTETTAKSADSLESPAKEQTDTKKKRKKKVTSKKKSTEKDSA